MMRFFFAFLLVSIIAVAATNDDTRGYLSAMNDFLESHTLGDVELMRVIDGCDKGNIVNPILESAANINPLTLAYREALQSWIPPGTVPKDLGPVLQIATGGNHACAVRTDGSVACWGDNTYRQLQVPKGLTVMSLEVAGKLR